MTTSERAAFAKIWQSELLFLMQELVKFTNEDSTPDEPILSHWYGQCHPYDLTLSFRQSSISIQLEMNKFPEGKTHPIRERETRHGTGSTKYSNDTRAQTDVKWQFTPDKYAPDSYLRKLYQEQGMPQDDIESRLDEIRTTRARTENLNETNMFYQYKYYWNLLGKNLNHSTPDLVEIFDKARRESHSDIIIQANSILSHVELYHKYVPELTGDPAKLNSFLYKFSHLIAYGFNHPQNPMPYIAYNAEQLRLGMNQRLALPEQNI